MSRLFHPCVGQRAAREAGPAGAALLAAAALLLLPSIGEAQGPSLAAKQIWGSGRDVPGLFGAVLTLRPAGSGVSVSGEWLTGTGPDRSSCSFLPDCVGAVTLPELRLLAGSVGYSARVGPILGNELSVRPALGVANLKEKHFDDGRSFISFGADVEASRSLFGLKRVRGLLGVSASASIALHPRSCVDCRIPSYDDGFQSVGLYLGLMMQMR